MIEVILFYAHAVFFVYIFAKNYVEQTKVSAYLSTIFVVIIFTVGWTFSAFDKDTDKSGIFTGFADTA